MSTVIIVQTLGGLGNQLFQIANGISLGLTYGRPIKFMHSDLSRISCLEVFGLKEKITYEVTSSTKIVLKPQKVKERFRRKELEEFKEETFEYNKIILPSKPTLLRGYFQSKKYFMDYELEIIDFYRTHLFRQKFVGRKEYERNLFHPENVFAHVRLGDYATNPITREYHGLLDEEYFLSAAEHMLGNHRNLLIVTESEELLEVFYPSLSRMAHYVISNSALSDLFTLSSAKKLILSNSSFSWWAGFLSDAQVIAPKKWFSPLVLEKKSIRDLIPIEWQQL